MTVRARRSTTVALAFAATQALTIVSWIMATALLRHDRGGDLRPAQYHGVLGWLSWDGGFYRVIAQNGYSISSPDAVRFFPLYPLLGRVVSYPFGGNTDLALLIVAKASVIIAAFGVYRVVRDEGFPERVAERSIWFWMLFPGAFVLGWAYSEALLVALAVWALWALRHRRWWLAAGLGFVAGLARPVGIALAAAALIEVCRGYSGRGTGGLIGRVAAVVAAPLGALAFCVYAAQRGFGFWAPLRVQDDLRHTESPLARLWSLPDTLTGHDAFTAGLHVPFVIAFIVLAVVVCRRLPLSYGAYAVLILLAALSAQNLNSIERYATSAFPLAIAGALALDGHERFEPAAYAFGGALSVGLCTMALAGAYVP